MFTIPNTYLGLSANKLSCIATELEQKNATLTAENVHLQRELKAEHALAEALGHDCERLKDENESLKDKNDQLRELVRDMYRYAFNREIELCNECACADDGDCGACGEYDGACGIAKRRFEELYSDHMRELGIEVES